MVEALACRDFLQAHGVEIALFRRTDENDSVTVEIEKCNAFEPDLSIDVHNNSGSGKGFGVYYHYKGGLSKDLAENIEAEVKVIGQSSRGCKTRTNSSGRDYYVFICETICPAVICKECCVFFLNKFSFFSSSFSFLFSNILRIFPFLGLLLFLSGILCYAFLSNNSRALLLIHILFPPMIGFALLAGTFV